MPGQPSEITIFSYQVGFGDCFLLRFHYPDGDRHVLVDFGTTKLPEAAPANQMVLVANDIAEKSGGKLEAVVATHRHADHISGFATKDGKGSGDIIAALKPELVIQPWTEAPDADDATLGPEVSTPERTMGQKLAALQNMHAFAEGVVRQLEGNGLDRAPTLVREQIDFIGRDNIANLSAVENLMTMGKERSYAFHGSDSGLGALLPGVTVTVLGPPTLRQTETIRKQRSRDPDEFWQLSLDGLDADANLHTPDEGQRLFPNHPIFPANRMPMEAMWFRDRLDEARASQMLSIVRSLDDQMNNTSLILLFEAGGKKLLFPGDAQIENWRFALSKPEVLDTLADVDLYKVGHHGSLNATPKTMWNNFKHRGGADTEGRLTTVMSTLPGKHGSEDKNTEVPRRTLVTALESDSDLHTTHRLDQGVLFQQVSVLLN